MEIVIKQFEHSLTPQVNRLIDSLFGEGYHKNKNLIDSNYFGFVAFSDKKMVGFSFYKVKENEIVFDIIGVSKEIQGKGIGRKLFKARFDNTIDINKPISIYHWVRKDNPIPQLAVKFGFSKNKRIPFYWRESSLKYNYLCLECEQIPCACTCDKYISNKKAL